MTVNESDYTAARIQDDAKPVGEQPENGLIYVRVREHFVHVSNRDDELIEFRNQQQGGDGLLATESLPDIKIPRLETEHFGKQVADGLDAMAPNARTAQLIECREYVSIAFDRNDERLKKLQAVRKVISARRRFRSLHRFNRYSFCFRDSRIELDYVLLIEIPVDSLECSLERFSSVDAP